MCRFLQLVLTRGFTPPTQPTYGTSYLLCERQKEFLIWLYNSGYHIDIGSFELSNIIKKGRYTTNQQSYLNNLRFAYEQEYIKSKNENKRNK